MRREEEDNTEKRETNSSKEEPQQKSLIIEIPLMSRLIQVKTERKKKEVIHIVDSDEEAPPKSPKTKEQHTWPKPTPLESKHSSLVKPSLSLPLICHICLDGDKPASFKMCVECKNNFHTSCLPDSSFIPVVYRCLQCQIFRSKHQQFCSKKELKKQQSYKIFSEFAKRYPFYIKEDRIRFPIEDKLLCIYPQLFQPQPVIRPQPIPHPSVPTNLLSPLLKIQNFFRTFQDCFESTTQVPRVQKCSLVQAFDCTGLDLLFCQLLYPVIQLYLSDIFFKNKTQNVKALSEHVFFTLLILLNDSSDIDMECVIKILPQLFIQFTTIPSFKFDLAFPSSFDLAIKIHLLETLIDGLNEVDEFREYVSNKSLEIQSLTKEKTELLPKLKAAQAQMLANRQHIQTNEIISMRASISKINATIPFVTTKIINLGSDRNRSQYFFSILEPSMVYTRHRHYILDTSQDLLVYTTKKTLIQLVKSFSQKGIRQRQLIQNMHSIIKDGLFEQSASPTPPKPPLTPIAYSNEVTFQVIHIMMAETEEMLSKYLEMRSFEWSPNREQLMVGLCDIRDVRRLAFAIRDMQEEFLFVQEEGRRRRPIRIWGINSERVKKYWLEYIEQCSSMASLWLITYILKKHVERYVDKKKNFMLEQEIRDKRRRPQNRVEKEKESSSEERRPKLRERRRMQIMSSSSSESENEQKCEICGEYGSLLCCDTCPKVFHLHCLNIKNIPQGKWSCFKCLEKMSNERQTRSKFKKNGLP